MFILDSIIRIIFLPGILFILLYKALPLMIKDFYIMVKEIYGIDLISKIVLVPMLTIAVIIKVISKIVERCVKRKLRYHNTLIRE